MRTNRKNFYNDAVNETIDYYKQWLVESGMTEEDLLAFRTVTKFKIEKGVLEGTGQTQVYMRYDNGIGCDYIGCALLSENTEKITLFLTNAAILLMHIAAKLDDANHKNPIDGSYVNDYFCDRVRKFIKKENIIQIDAP
jgi:uncharacterized protein (UPF0128 family)